MRAFWLALLVLALGACEPPSPLEKRSQTIERKFLSSCSCLPKKVAGHAIQTKIRTAIRSAIEGGRGDREILLDLIDAYGDDLLAIAGDGHELPRVN